MMKYLSAQDLEDQTTIARRTWLYWAKIAKVPSYKVGSRVLFREREIQEFIESGLSDKVIADREIKRDVDEIMRRAEKNWARSDERKRLKEEKERRDKEDGVTSQKTSQKIKDT